MITPDEGTTIIDGKVYMIDGKGRHVPFLLVKPEHKLEDQMVRTIMGYASDLSEQVARFKGHCIDDIATFLALLSEVYGAKRGGQKGNMTFTSYDGCLQVRVAIADQLTFGPELQIAKDLIDECIAEWAEGSRDEIRALVDHAFEPRKAGLVNREAIFSLRRVEIVDPRWTQAQQAITDSIRVQGTKQYIRFYRRATPTDGWEPITIDIASARRPQQAAEVGV